MLISIHADLPGLFFRFVSGSQWWAILTAIFQNHIRYLDSQYGVHNIDFAMQSLYRRTHFEFTSKRWMILSTCSRQLAFSFGLEYAKLRTDSYYEATFWGIGFWIQWSANFQTESVIGYHAKVSHFEFECTNHRKPGELFADHTERNAFDEGISMLS